MGWKHSVYKTPKLRLCSSFYHWNLDFASPSTSLYYKISFKLICQTWKVWTFISAVAPSSKGSQWSSLILNTVLWHAIQICLSSRNNTSSLSVERQFGVLLALNAMLTSARFEKSSHWHPWTIAGRATLQCMLFRVRRCYMNQAPALLRRKLKRTSHHRSTRGNKLFPHPFEPSSPAPYHFQIALPSYGLLFNLCPTYAKL